MGAKEGKEGLTQHLDSASVEADLKALFDKMDKNGDKSLSEDEWRSLAKEIYKDPSKYSLSAVPSLTKPESEKGSSADWFVSSLFKFADKDQNGTISWEEFLGFCIHIKGMKPSISFRAWLQPSPWNADDGCCAALRKSFCETTKDRYIAIEGNKALYAVTSVINKSTDLFHCDYVVFHPDADIYFSKSWADKTDRQNNHVYVFLFRHDYPKSQFSDSVKFMRDSYHQFPKHCVCMFYTPNPKTENTTPPAELLQHIGEVVDKVPETQIDLYETLVSLQDKQQIHDFFMWLVNLRYQKENS